MSTIQTLLASEPHVEFSSQYAPVEESMNSIICFINYYDQVFKESKTDVALHLIFFDANGVETGYKQLSISANDAIQFNPKSEGFQSNGMVAVAAVPKKNIHEINKGSLKIRNKVGTGFYIRWENPNGGKDLMHEWAALQMQHLSEETHHIGIVNTTQHIDHGVILMNPIADAYAVCRPTLHLRAPGTKEVIESITLEPIPSLGTRFIKYSDVLSKFNNTLKSDKKLVIDVIAENMSPPLTAEWNKFGDFHFHHI
jgi:hypothetical protein